MAQEPLQGTILVIDDVPENLRILVELLTNQGYNVRPAPDGELALQYVQTHLPDLILLDIKMPGIDGYEVCRRLKAETRTCDIPVIFISAADQMIDKMKAFSVGGVDYIIKPFQPEEVLARVETHLSLWQLQRNLQDEIQRRKEAEAALQETNQRLEERVRERTAELMQANEQLQAEILERQKYAETLRLMDAAVQASIDGITISDITQPDNPLIFVNKGFERLTGYAEEEVVGRNCRFLQRTDRKQPVLPKIRAALRDGKIERVHLRNYHKDGTLFWNELTLYPLHDDAGNLTHFVGVQHDITERIKTETALEASRQAAYAFQERLKALHEVSIELSRTEALDDLYYRIIEMGRTRLGFDRLGLWLLEENSDLMVSDHIIGTYGIDTQGQIRDEKHLRYKITDLIRANEFFDSRERLMVWEDVPLLEESVPTEQYGWHVIASLWNADRYLGWISADNFNSQQPLQSYKPELLALYSATVAHLITRKQTELAIQENEELFKDIFDGAADAIILFDENQQIIRFNAFAERIFGFDANEVIGQPINILLPDRFISNHIRHFQNFAAAPEITRMMGAGREVIGKRKDQTEFPAEAAISKLTQKGKRVYLAILRDMTERNKAEKLRIDLEREQELRELKSKFFSMITHDFRNPLATIQLSADTLQNYADRLNQKQKTDRLAAILEQVTHLNDLLEDVLITERMEIGKSNYQPTIMDLEAFCRAAFDELRLTLGKQHQLTYTSDSPSLMMNFDANLMRRIITNLLSNAVKYSPNGSRVYFDLSTDDTHITIRVADEGIGIPEEDQEHLFNTFQRASNVKSIQGTGLGLAIVKQAVELHGGSITFESKENTGTVFIVTFPRENHERPFFA